MNVTYFELKEDNEETIIQLKKNLSLYKKKCNPMRLNIAIILISCNNVLIDTNVFKNYGIQLIINNNDTWFYRQTLLDSNSKYVIWLRKSNWSHILSEPLKFISGNSVFVNIKTFICRL